MAFLTYDNWMLSEFRALHRRERDTHRVFESKAEAIVLPVLTTHNGRARKTDVTPLCQASYSFEMSRPVWSGMNAAATMLMTAQPAM
jgi:hypothetical protein